MKCETLFYVELEERLCGEPAVALLDGTSPRCADCAKYCHPSRLTEIVPPKMTMVLRYPISLLMALRDTTRRTKREDK